MVVLMIRNCLTEGVVITMQEFDSKETAQHAMLIMMNEYDQEAAYQYVIVPK